MSKVAIVGANLNGLVTAALLNPELSIVIYDFDSNKISQLRDKQLTYKEPQLYEKLYEMHSIDNLIQFKVIEDYSWLEDIDVLILAVKQPEIDKIIEQVAKINSSIKILLTTILPIQTCDNIVSQYGLQVLYVANNYTEGSIFKDAEVQKHIIIGRSTTIKVEEAQELAMQLFGQGKEYHIVSNKVAILTKQARDTFLALHIGYANELNQMCHAVDIDYMQVRDLMALDHRVHPTYMVPCPGYGGTGLIEATKSLSSQYSEVVNKWMPRSSKLKGIMAALVDSNTSTFGCAYTWLSDILLKYPEAKTIGILGMTFKENSNDIVESRFLDIAKAIESEALLSSDFSEILLYDEAFDREILSNSTILTINTNIEQILQKSDILIVNHAKYVKYLNDAVAKVIIDFSGLVKPEQRKELYSWIA